MNPSEYKLPKRLNAEYDRKIITSFRQWEKLEKKIAAFRNHLHFTLHCKHHEVTPPSLKLKCAMKGPAIDAILGTAQRALCRQRITDILGKLEDFESRRAEADEFLFTILDNDRYAETKEWMAHARQRTFQNIRERQQRKFSRLLEAKMKKDSKVNGPIVEVSKEEEDRIKSKWIVNLSDRVLNEEEETVLKQGLNFAVTPSAIPVEEFIIGVESACRCIGPASKEAQMLRADSVRILKNAPPPKPNLKKKERIALDSLARDKDITIVPADKGRAVVVMNAADYKAKANSLLSDTKTYQKLDKDPTSKFSTKLVNQLKDLKKENVLDEREYRRVYPTSAVIPRFYGLPKVHKQGAPLRPIVASRGSITYNLAQMIAQILSPLVGKNGYALKNSAAMVQELSQLTLKESDVLVSFDVTALFTKVPVDRSLDIILDRLEKDASLSSRTRLTAVQIRDLLRTCLKTTYFQYDGVIYTQVEGAAMGSPISPIVANLYMEWFEETALQSFPFQLTVWKRYVDDTFVALCASLISELTKHINSLDPSIQFTKEEEADNSLPMLDTLTTRDNEGRLSFTVYRKPTHTDQYLQFGSFQPFNHKLGVIRTLHHRCMTLCSSEEAKISELDHLKKVLSVSGYTKAAWNTATAVSHRRAHRQNTDNTARVKGSVTLPYAGPVSEAIARNIRKTGVMVHLRPTNTIRSRLVHPKDKLDRLEQAGVVYKIKCNDCPETYVGETERRLQQRFNEHRRASSPVGRHVEDQGHSIDEESVSVLHKETDWFRRGVAEAVHIQRETPSLNQGRERHILPAIYRELLSAPDEPLRGSRASH